MRARILAVTPWCLLDCTNGGAIHVRSLLRGLARRGAACEAVTGGFHTSDVYALARRHEDGTTRLRRYRLRMRRREDVVVVDDRPIVHHISGGAKQALGDLLARRLDRFRPDVIVTWGKDGSEAEVVDVGRRFGIPVVLLVLTATYPVAAEAARGAALVVANSGFLARFLARQLGTRVEVAYPVNDAARFLAHARNGRDVTFMNPVPEKGIAILCRIVEVAWRQLPEARFAIVEGRWTRRDLAATGINLAEFPSVRFVRNRVDVRPLYAATRVLLYPSVWPEAFGLGVVEAQANGIPVIANGVGGIPEAMNGGGTVLTAPDRCLRDWDAIPEAAEVQPWIDRLTVLLRDPAAHRRAGGRARRAARRFDAARILEETEHLLASLVSY